MWDPRHVEPPCALRDPTAKRSRWSRQPPRWPGSKRQTHLPSCAETTRGDARIPAAARLSRRAPLSDPLAQKASTCSLKHRVLCADSRPSPISSVRARHHGIRKCNPARRPSTPPIPPNIGDTYRSAPAALPPSPLELRGEWYARQCDSVPSGGSSSDGSAHPPGSSHSTIDPPSDAGHHPDWSDRSDLFSRHLQSFVLARRFHRPPAECYSRNQWRPCPNRRSFVDTHPISQWCHRHSTFPADADSPSPKSNQHCCRSSCDPTQACDQPHERPADECASARSDTESPAARRRWCMARAGLRISDSPGGHAASPA